MGAEWFKKTFPRRAKSAIPQVLWQIDPFGSSEVTPLLINDQQK
jgi:hypothetical protein